MLCKEAEATVTGAQHTSSVLFFWEVDAHGEFQGFVADRGVRVRSYRVATVVGETYVHPRVKLVYLLYCRFSCGQQTSYFPFIFHMHPYTPLGRLAFHSKLASSLVLAVLDFCKLASSFYSSS